MSSIHFCGRLRLALSRYNGRRFRPPKRKEPLAQYVGPLHRDHAGKRDVVAHDYIDAEARCSLAWLISKVWPSRLGLSSEVDGGCTS